MDCSMRNYMFVSLFRYNIVDYVFRRKRKRSQVLRRRNAKLNKRRAGNECRLWDNIKSPLNSSKCKVNCLFIVMKHSEHLAALFAHALWVSTLLRCALLRFYRFAENSAAVYAATTTTSSSERQCTRQYHCAVFAWVSSGSENSVANFYLSGINMTYRLLRIIESTMLKRKSILCFRWTLILVHLFYSGTCYITFAHISGQISATFLFSIACTENGCAS